MAGKLSEEQKAKIVQRYHDGESGPSLSREYGVCYNLVYAAVRESGQRVRTNSAAHTACPYSPARLNELYWAQKCTLKEISSSVGASVTSAHRWLRQAGIKRRSSHVGQQLSIRQGKSVYNLIGYGGGDGRALREHHRLHPEQVRAAGRKGASVSNTRRSEDARRVRPCTWCGELIARKGSRLRAQFPACNRQHAVMVSRWRVTPDQPRPLILAKLRELLREHPYKALPFTRETLEKAGATIGAGEPEIIEVMLEART